MTNPSPSSDGAGALEALAGVGVLSALDVHFAGLLARLTGDRSAPLALAAALASRAVRAGHVCLRLDDPGAVVPDDAPLEVPEPGAWARGLAGSPAVARPGEPRPLVLDHAGRLYLYRYWRYEHDLAAWVRERAGAPDLPVGDPAGARQVLARLFPDREGRTDFQKVAAAVALLRPLAILSGGPGTGKTFTVVRILALLLSQPGGERLRIALAAPTGKAAARLQEAVRAAKAGPGPVAGLGAAGAIPETAFTLHRLLGAVPGSSAFRHGPDNPLPHDVVVVDEVSMVDLALMAKLVVALRPGARLVLVGDRDQLASVEAGSVLGDLCDTGRDHGVPREMAAPLEELTGCDLAAEARDEPPLARGLVVLRRNYRFPGDSAIGRVTRAVNRGLGAEALRLLREAGGEVSWHDLSGPRALLQALAPAAVQGLEPVLELLEQGDPEAAFDRLQGFRILCALREGPFGAGAVNRAVRRCLAEGGLAPAEGEWYPGRPVLVTRNDYTLRLFNGDVGLTFRARDGALRVLFPAPDGGFREIPPVRIGACETVYAMTVHKAQGSEFDRVALVLGDRPSRVLTRELVYTGITRARSRVEVWGSEQAFLWAVGRRAERSSGLRDALWGTPPGC